MTEFDRYGKCPICRKLFKSEECLHSFDYVVKVLASADAKFQKDVAKVRASRKAAGGEG